MPPMAGCRARTNANTAVVASSKKVDIKKQGLATVKDKIVQANLMGISEKMNKKGWTDSQGRKGKVSQPCCRSPVYHQQDGCMCLDNQHGTEGEVGVGCCFPAGCGLLPGV